MKKIMNRKIFIMIIGSVLLIVLIFVIRDLRLRSPKLIQCDDGQRRTIDIRDFSTQYWAYSLELEANLSNRIKLESKVDPKQLQQLSEALQQANEFRKYLVAGYNSCAISKAQYSEIGSKFHALDSLARQINSELVNADSPDGNRMQIAELVKQYINLTQQIPASTKK